jgi:sterol desaturase/sphingolipid hydroxylase (fatty acid hydroxylase superfamily)
MLLQFLLHVIGYDIWFYVSHRALHTRVLWFSHRIHHQKVEPVWTDTYHGHWFETVFQSWGFFLPWCCVWPVSWWTAAIALAAINVRAMLHHDRRGTFLVGDYHLVHHRRPGVNYGQPWLDWLGGTYHLAKGASGDRPCPP